MTLLVALSLAGALAQPQASPPSTTGMITGRVVEEGSHIPIPGVRVMLMSISNIPRQRPPFEPPKESVTDQDGRYTFTAVDAGTYVLNLQKAGFAPLYGGAAARVQIAAGERHEQAVITLSRGGAITGRVLDQSGQPIADAHVTAWRRMPARPGTGDRARTLLPVGPGAQTNDLGEFRLYSLAPDTYYIQASPRREFGFSGTSSETTMTVPTFYPDTIDQAAAQAVTVAGGQTFADVVIRMAVVSAFQVSGLVVDESGGPVSGAEVSLMPERGTGPGAWPFEPPNRTRTDAGGRFTIGNVSSGTYTLMAAAPVIISSNRRSGGASGGLSGWASGTTFGPAGASTSTETINGVTTEFRNDPAHAVPVTVSDANVADIRVVAPRPQR